MKMLLRLLPPACLCLVLAACSPDGNVRTPRKPVVNEYHGVKVTDDYQWLEDAKAAGTREWTAKQNARSRAYWDKLQLRDNLADELEELYEASSANYYALSYRSNINFMMRFRPPQQQPVLIARATISRPEEPRVIVDPNQINTNGTTTIDWFVPSPNGRLVAVSMSEKGSEDGALHFFDVRKTNDNKLADIVPRVQYPTAGGSAAWAADGSGVFYTRFPHKGERPAGDENFYQQVYFHKLGTPHTEDRYEVGKEFPRIAEIELEPSDDGKLLLARVANGDGGDFSFWLRSANGAWKQLAKDEDGIKFAAFSHDSLYLLSRRDAPRGKILRIKLDAAGLSLANATLFVPEGDAVIDNFAPSAKGLYVKDLIGGPSQVRYFNLEGKELHKVGFRSPVNVQQMLVRRGEELTLRVVSYTRPYSWNYYFPGATNLIRTALAGRSPANFDDVEAVREMATSKDGTKIPLNIIRRKGTKLDGNNPVILYGYGGYGISLAPDFRASRRLWLDAGGVYAIANLRGGGEFGEEWHKAGNLAKKQNVFDDFIACAEFLVKTGYTKPSRLAIQGGSNGGLLMGAALTQRPDLFRAVAASVGIYDMLRVELEPNGAFNVTEFGTVKDKTLFDALYAYSPYHRVTNGLAYPAVLFTTGENDGRVNPYNSKKMTARLQTATSSGHPVLLRTSASAGHGRGSSLRDRVAEEADVLTFLMDQLGVDIERWYSKSPIERGPLSGAVTPTSALVKAKLRDTGAKARLVVSTDPQLKNPVYSPLAFASVDRNRVVPLPISGLKPDTQYHYGVEVDGKIEPEKNGRFRTFPKEGPASFRFAFASCARTGTTNTVFDVIRKNEPLFYMNTGDFHYRDITNNNVRRFRRAYDMVLKSAPQAALYRNVPLNYVWDDHDFGGDNASRRRTTLGAAHQAYEEYMPHYPLPRGDGGPINHTFAVGRVKFIVTDLRSQRDSPREPESTNKTMMGQAQKAWFKKELLDGRDNYALTFWVSSVPWIGAAGSNYYRVHTNVFGYIHHTNITEAMRPPSRNRDRDRDRDDDRDNDSDNDSDEDADNANTAQAADDDDSDTTNTAQASNRNSNQRRDRGGNQRGDRGGGRGRSGGRERRYPFGQDFWGIFANERREIADFIKQHNIRNLAILHGDAHMLAADDGSHSDYADGGGAKIPVMCGGPLDQNASIKGGPYSQGVYRVKKDEGCFGLIDLTDDGKTVRVKFSGRNNENVEKIALEFAVSPGG